MKKFNSVEYVLLLASTLSMNELPFENRTDNWWDMFWHNLGLETARQLGEKI